MKGREIERSFKEFERERRRERERERERGRERERERGGESRERERGRERGRERERERDDLNVLFHLLFAPRRRPPNLSLIQTPPSHQGRTRTGAWTPPGQIPPENITSVILEPLNKGHMSIIVPCREVDLISEV